MMKQLLSGLDRMHQIGILHRDLKPANILVDERYNCYIADLGLSRSICQPLREYTNEIFTLYYRSPELVLGEKRYSISVDIWALGCVFYEMITGEVLFKCSSELELLFLIFRTFGRPTTSDWPELAGLLKSQHSEFVLPDLNMVSNLGQRLAGFDAGVSDLIMRMIRMNPNRRPTCAELLLDHIFDDIAI